MPNLFQPSLLYRSLAHSFTVSQSIQQRLSKNPQAAFLEEMSMEVDPNTLFSMINTQELAFNDPNEYGPYGPIGLLLIRKLLQMKLPNNLYTIQCSEEPLTTQSYQNTLSSEQQALLDLFIQRGFDPWKPRQLNPQQEAFLNETHNNNPSMDQWLHQTHNDQHQVDWSIFNAILMTGRIPLIEWMLNHPSAPAKDVIDKHVVYGVCLTPFEAMGWGQSAMDRYFEKKGGLSIPTLFAAQQNLDALKLWKERGFDINQDENSRLPPAHACANMKFFKEFIELGGDPEAENQAEENVIDFWNKHLRSTAQQKVTREKAYYACAKDALENMKKRPWNEQWLDLFKKSSGTKTEFVQRMALYSGKRTKMPAIVNPNNPNETIWDLDLTRFYKINDVNLSLFLEQTTPTLEQLKKFNQYAPENTQFFKYQLSHKYGFLGASLVSKEAFVEWFKSYLQHKVSLDHNELSNLLPTLVAQIPGVAQDPYQGQTTLMARECEQIVQYASRQTKPGSSYELRTFEGMVLAFKCIYPYLNEPIHEGPNAPVLAEKLLSLVPENQEHVMSLALKKYLIEHHPQRAWAAILISYLPRLNSYYGWKEVNTIEDFTKAVKAEWPNLDDLKENAINLPMMLQTINTFKEKYEKAPSYSKNDRYKNIMNALQSMLTEQLLHQSWSDPSQDDSNTENSAASPRKKRL